MQSLATCPAVHPDSLTTEQRLGECLNRFGDALTLAGSGRWWITRPGDGTRTAVIVHQDWLIVEQALSGLSLTRTADTQRWSRQLLDAGRSLPSGARPVLSADDDLVRMRAERSLSPLLNNEVDDLWHWIESACTDVADGPDAMPATTAAEDAHEPRGRDGTDQSEIAALCELAGWPASARSTSNETVIPLPARNGDVCHAIATAAGSAIRFRTALELESANEMTPACRAAVTVALLRVAGSVRLIRSTLTRVGENIGATFDAHVQLPLGPETVGDALSSLTVARHQIAAELDALAGNDSLAIAYLALQGARC
jgi:hypothetical protein